MSLTLEQRRDINAQNARKSTGPKSDQGKDRSRQNALKHGLRAEVLALPNEDPAIIAERADTWNDHYKPRSPAAQHLVNECVRDDPRRLRGPLAPRRAGGPDPGGRDGSGSRPRRGSQKNFKSNPMGF
jgi:hypothetical protein